MTWRLSLAMALLAAAILLAASVSVVHELRAASERQSATVAGELSRTFAREMRVRLSVAESIVQQLTSEDAGFGGADLRERMLHSEVFRGVVLTTPASESGPVALNQAERMALRAGQALLRTAARKGTVLPVYVVHSVRVGVNPALAFFELSPDWLWQALDNAARPQSSLAVIDGAGVLLRVSGELSADLLSMFAREYLSAAPPGGEGSARSWSVARQEWRGSGARAAGP